MVVDKSHLSVAVLTRKGRRGSIATRCRRHFRVITVVELRLSSIRPSSENEYMVLVAAVAISCVAMVADALTVVFRTPYRYRLTMPLPY